MTRRRPEGDWTGRCGAGAAAPSQPGRRFHPNYPVSPAADRVPVEMENCGTQAQPGPGAARRTAITRGRTSFRRLRQPLRRASQSRALPFRPFHCPSCISSPQIRPPLLPPSPSEHKKSTHRRGHGVLSTDSIGLLLIRAFLSTGLRGFLCFLTNTTILYSPIQRLGSQEREGAWLRSWTRLVSVFWAVLYR